MTELKKLIIIDDFFDNPEEICNLAYSKNYSSPPQGSARLARTAVCSDEESKYVVSKILPHVPYIDKHEVMAFRVLFRYSLEGTKKRVFCHVDRSTYAGIVYLTKPKYCAGGTSIFRHIPTGDIIYDINHAHMYNFSDENQWELISEIDMKFNRLVMYPGKYFHSITPVFFGDDITNSRLTQNVFIYRDHDKV